MNERILIVGATGFLGSFVTGLLHERAPIALARPTSDLRVLRHGVEVRMGDLDHPLPLDGVGALVYCASMGFGHIPQLIAQLERSGVRRAVFTSTTAVYTSLPAPSRAIRLEAEAAVQHSSLEWTIVRPTMIYGSARDRNISRLLRFLKRWPMFPVCGDGLWQPVYVTDLANAVIAALDSARTVRHAYNLAGAEPLRFTELVRTAGRAVGRYPLLVRVPMHVAELAARVTHVVSVEQVRRLAEDKAFAYDDAQRDFGFSARSFAEGVALEAAELGLSPGRPARPRSNARRGP